MDRFFKSNGLSKGPSIQGFTGGGGVWMGWLVFCWLFFAIKKKHGIHTENSRVSFIH